MKKIISIIALSLFGAASSYAYSINAGLYGIGGSDGYAGFSGYVQVKGQNFSVRPMVNTAKYDGLDGTMVDYSLRLGYDYSIISLGLTGGFMPNYDGFSYDYGRLYGSVDGSVYLIGDRETAHYSRENTSGLLAVNAGGALSYVQHKYKHSDPEKIGQSSFSLFGSAALAGFTGTLRYTQTIEYSKDTDASRMPIFNMDNAILSVFDGYVNNIWSARLDTGIIPFIRPFFSYAHVSRKYLGNINNYAVGVAVDVLMVNVSASYQYMVYTGQDNKDYYSISAGLRF